MLTLYKLKDAARRASALLGVATLSAGVLASSVPAAVFADALNPLTERSLTLSSSSPGWSYKDGSGNTKYAPPNSGANGQKTGNTFTFRVSSDSTSNPIKAFTFQYCTKSAGQCRAPGDDYAATVPGTDDATHTDLSIHTNSPSLISSTNWDAVLGDPSLTPPANSTPGDGDDRTLVGNFVVLTAPANDPLVNGVPDYEYPVDGSSDPIEDWTMSASNQEEVPAPGTQDLQHKTGKVNMITIKSPTGLALNAQDYVKVIFFATDTNYITNPGSGAFFVKINDYNNDDYQNWEDAFPLTAADACDTDHVTFLGVGTGTDTCNADRIDGGVTVANVMNESISIQTKVLETMDFSVGTYDPDLYTDAQLDNVGLDPHKQCSALLMANPTDPLIGVTDPAGDYAALPHNVLKLGDSTAEYSLSTEAPYSVQSYWRLSSNSSGGATVYYTGHTLTNTENDEIAPLSDDPNTDASTESLFGNEQFGLAIAHGSDTGIAATGGDDALPVWLDGAESYGDADQGSGDGDFSTFLEDHDTQGDVYAHSPRLWPLVPTPSYGFGAGTLGDSGTRFAFNAHADTYAIPIASESTDVVNCVTAKMRYLANIAATTPAGIYTTKINYVASPQY